jgi:hypothetical protein
MVDDNPEAMAVMRDRLPAETTRFVVRGQGPEVRDS